MIARTAETLVSPPVRASGPTGAPAAAAAACTVAVPEVSAVVAAEAGATVAVGLPVLAGRATPGDRNEAQRIRGMPSPSSTPGRPRVGLPGTIRKPAGAGTRHIRASAGGRAVPGLAVAGRGAARRATAGWAGARRARGRGTAALVRTRTGARRFTWGRRGCGAVARLWGRVAPHGAPGWRWTLRASTAGRDIAAPAVIVPRGAVGRLTAVAG
jgi:hypothetical protein